MAAGPYDPARHPNAAIRTNAMTVVHHISSASEKPGANARAQKGN
jgi:hypothetical protein